MKPRALIVLNAIFALSLAVIALSIGLRPATATTYSATVSATSQQTIKGWGCHGFEGTVPAAVETALCTNLGMTIDRIYIDDSNGADTAGNVATASMDNVCAAITTMNNHGIKYYISSWSPNPGMKTPSAPQSFGTFNSTFANQFATYWVNICKYIQNKGLPLPVAIGLQNEPTNGGTTYDNMAWLNDQSGDFTQYIAENKLVRSALDSAGFSAVKIVGPEDGGIDSGSNWGNSDMFLGGTGYPFFTSDPTFAAAIWGVATHSYYWATNGAAGLQNFQSSCATWGKDEWMTEYSYIENGEPSANLTDIAVGTARRLASDMACVRFNYWFWWDGYFPSIGNNPNEQLTPDGVTMNPQYYVLQKIFNNAPPGSVVHPITSTDPNMHLANNPWMDGVAWVNGNTTTVLLVNSTTGTASTTSINGLTGTASSIYQTVGSQNMALIGTPAVSGGTISSVTLPAWSVTVIVTSTTVSVPPAPTGLTATASPAQVSLTWNSSTGATSYNVYRGTAAGGESTTAIATGIATAAYTNTGLTNGTTYYYKVKAVNSAGSSGYSNEASATPQAAALPIQINAAGPVVSPFVADVDFSGGLIATNWTGAITTTGVTNPAPQAVYQSERYGAMTYTIPGLVSGTSYTVRLHLCENYFTASAQRKFNVSINSTSVLSNFDIFASTGAVHKATVQQFATTGNASGQIVIAFTNVVNNALINGIEILAGAPAPPPTPTGLTATAGNAQVSLAWNASSGATAYDVKRSTVSGSGYATVSSPTVTNYTNTGLTNGTTYYFVVDAKNASGTSANSAQVSATPANSGANLSGTSTTPPATINLTTEGVTDWGQWGKNNTHYYKTSGGSKISDITYVAGANGWWWDTNETVSFSWTNGSPTTSLTTAGIMNYSALNAGFKITALADTTQRTLKVYLKGDHNVGKLTAHLSDGSAADFVDSSHSSTTGSYYVVYTLSYKAASAGQTLSVTWISSTDYSGNNGCYVGIQAASLF